MTFFRPYMRCSMCECNTAHELTIALQDAGTEGPHHPPVAPSALHRMLHLCAAVYQCNQTTRMRPYHLQHIGLCLAFSVTAWAISSQSTTGTPCRLKKVVAADLPVAMPPVSPTTFILHN